MNTKKFNRELFKWSRWLHVYCSTALFGLLVFFSITGIFLNHVWYDSDSNKTSTEEITISEKQIEQWLLRKQDDDWNPDTKQIVDYLKQQFGLPTPSSIDLDAELGELVFEFQLPAGFATALFIGDEASFSFESEKGSLVGIMNDLHKGRHSGKVWGWLIDISAGLMVLFGITGMIILFQGKKFKVGGTISFVLGLVSPVLIYFLFVPR